METWLQHRLDKGSKEERKGCRMIKMYAENIMLLDHNETRRVNNIILHLLTRAVVINF